MQVTRTVALLVAACAGWTGSAVAQETPSTDETVRRAVHVCAACHGDEGRSTTSGIPSLAGQPRMYLVNQLKDFRGQTRTEGGSRAYMWGISALLDDATIDGLADHFSTLPPPPGTGGAPSMLQAGARIFNQGMSERGVRPCAACHGSKAEGSNVFPRLAGQRADYVLAQLKTFGTGLRPHAVLMRRETSGMTQQDMRAVAAYVQSQ